LSDGAEVGNHPLVSEVLGSNPALYFVKGC